MNIFLSTSKKGYGVRELLSEDEESYWSTDSALPHWILITSNYIRYIYSIKVLLSYQIDDSYTPEEIEVSFNSKSFKIKFDHPEGYEEILIDDFIDKINIKIISNHSDGKDSHIHHLRAFKSPKEEIYFYQGKA